MQIPISEASGSVRALIEREARAAGFDALAITATDAIPLAAERLARFIALGRHGDMAWMAGTAERRGSPRALWPEARSAIMLARSYAPEGDPMAGLAQRSRGLVSCYAQGRDYHDTVKAGLRRVARILAAETDADVKVFVDTAPLMEKPLAEAAGLGWQGRHTNLVSRTLGNWFFLGAILTTAVLPADAPEADHCGTCRRCLDICPTNAFPAPYQLDARRCISYLTIEHRGHIPAEFREPMANRIFGCDDCLAACPWNKFAGAGRKARAATGNPPLADLLALDDAAFRQRFRGTPVKRTGRDRIVRNALIAAGNSGDPSLVPAIEALLDDPSSLVRAMAVWALWRLADRTRVTELAVLRLPAETDEHVRREWEARA
jgi:epoxyqueuosine reductase